MKCREHIPTHLPIYSQTQLVTPYKLDPRSLRNTNVQQGHENMKPTAFNILSYSRPGVYSVHPPHPNSYCIHNFFFLFIFFRVPCEQWQGTR